MELFTKNLMSSLLVGVVTIIAGCFSVANVPNDWEQKYSTSSSKKKSIVIGRILVPEPDYSVAARWLVLQKIGENNYIERNLQMKVESDGWFSSSLELGTYCLISYYDSNSKDRIIINPPILPMEIMERWKDITALFEVPDSSEATYIGTLVCNPYDKWTIENESEAAIYRLSKMFPSYEDQLMTKLAVLETQR